LVNSARFLPLIAKGTSFFGFLQVEAWMSQRYLIDRASKMPYAMPKNQLKNPATKFIVKSDLPVKISMLYSMVGMIFSSSRPLILLS